MGRHVRNGMFQKVYTPCCTRNTQLKKSLQHAVGAQVGLFTACSGFPNVLHIEWRSVAARSSRVKLRGDVNVHM